MPSVSIVIADRHPVFLHGLMTLLSADRNFNVVASCNDGEKCIELIRNLSPQIAILDIFMPGLSGLEILAIISRERMPTRIVFFTESAEERDLIVAAARGAYGVVLKETSPETMMECLRQVAAGRRFLPSSYTNGDAARGQDSPLRSPAADNALTALTERERQIMRLVSEGLSNKEIGRQLNLSDGTIKVHLHHIYQKLAISNRTALAALAFSHQ
jgi:two-component system nitrate/nitrite response regulator NarL